MVLISLKQSHEMQTNQGFSLVELLVAAAIVTLISVITLTNHRGFDSSVTLTNLAHEVALSVREAQVFGISVRGEGGSFSAGYGLHFDLDTPGTFILFSDSQVGGGYSSGSDTDIDVYTFQQRYGVSDIIDMSGGAISASDQVDIVFTRPNPEPVFYVNNSVRDTSGLRVQIQAPDGSTREVEIFSTGQVSVVYD